MIASGNGAVPNLDAHDIRIRSHTLGVTVTASLEARIASGEYPPGYRLPPERELARMLDVSRTTLRHAMGELESKRLIERRPGRGTIVAAQQIEVGELLRGLQASEQEVVNVSELRALIEPGIAGHAAMRARQSNLLRLEDVLARSNESLSATESLRLDIEFHLLLAQSAQNPLLLTILELSNGWARDVRLGSHRTKSARRASLEGHRRILDCVEARDVAGATAAMTAHLSEVRTLIVDSITEADPLDSSLA